MKNVENSISEPLGFKILGVDGSHTSLQTCTSGPDFQALQLKI